MKRHDMLRNEMTNLTTNKPNNYLWSLDKIQNISPIGHFGTSNPLLPLGDFTLETENH